MVALLFALCLGFALGGSSRGDAGQLLVLRPLSVLILGYALYQLRAEDIRAFRGPIALIAAYAGLVALQLVPLPYSLWSSLPGRELVVDIDKAARLGLISRPLSLTPPATWNALFALALPIAVFLLMIRVTPQERATALAALLAIGMLSAILAILQILGDPQGLLYFYRWTNNGSAVGLFANRNHQSVFLACLIPIAWIVLARTGLVAIPLRCATITFSLAFVAFVGVVFTLILVTGSRAGFAASLLALASLTLLRRDQSKPESKGVPAEHRSHWGSGLVALVLAGLGIAAVALDRALAISRLLGDDEVADMRVRILPTVRSMISEYLPWGSGFGSFQAVYQVHEPDELLGPTYMNHAHNDWLEFILDGGLPALALLIAAMVLIAKRMIELWRESHDDMAGKLSSRLGLIVLGLLAFASFFDYPLRVPALACVGMLALFLAFAAPAKQIASDPDASGKRV